MDTTTPRPTIGIMDTYLDYMPLIYYLVLLLVVVLAVVILVESCSSPTNQLTKNPGYTPRTNEEDSPPGYNASTSPLFTIYSPHQAPATARAPALTPATAPALTPAPAPALTPAPARAASSSPSLVLGAVGLSGRPASPPFTCIYVRE